MPSDETPPPTTKPSMQGFDEAMGFHLVSATAEQVVLEYRVEARHRQPYGIVHGGVHSAAFETVCSTGAAMAVFARGQSVVGLENHTSYIRAVRDGLIRIEARPLTRGRRSQVWEATARDEEGRLVATGRVRLLCLEPGSDLGGKPVGVTGGG